ncbi:MAG TPA: helix-turn-helix domain-containing protein [Stellaceae bacterium]|nr:helix-turn-helix domain-containing protein [Stellaceae bacterium]
MQDPQSDPRVRQWSDRFRKDRLAKAVVVGLRDRADEIWHHAFHLLQRESAEYRNSVDEEFAGESKSHCNALLSLIVATAAGEMRRRGLDAFDIVRTHAQWRAQHRVPLIASLHAYRIAHRTYSELSQDALARHGKPKDIVRSQRMLSDFWIEFFDHIGSVLAEAHAVEEGLIIAQEGRRYATLFDDLLRGIAPSDRELQRLCALRGIRPSAPLAVAVAKPRLPVDGHPVDLEVTLRSFRRLLEQVLSPAVFGSLVDIRNDQVTAIVCTEAETGRKLLQALRRGGFAKRAANGHAAYVGISRDVAEIGELPEALKEAEVAFQFADVPHPLMHFPNIELTDLLVRRADRIAFRLIPAWASRLHAAADGQSRELSRTIRAFALCNFNVKRTAHLLGVHTNTVYFRLNRMKKLSGLDPRTYAGASTILAALRLLETHGGTPAT